MGLLECSNTYRAFAGTCTQCGHCTGACTSLTTAQMTLGDIAKHMLAAERASETVEDLAVNLISDEQLVQAVRGCFFCTSCKNTCFAHNDVCDLIYHARVDFQKAGLIPKEAWSSVQVDQQWDVFTAYRAVYGITFADLTRHIATEQAPAATDCQVAFFPGCALAAYGPELTREIFGTIEELGGKTTLLDHCCGSPLKSAGFFDRAEALCNRISDEVVSSGASQIVCVCPGCANAMKKTLARNGVEGVEVTTLPAFLNDHGFTAEKPLPDSPLFISKSCQDRDGSYLEQTCQVLGIDQETPSVFNGCCGAGGAVSAFNPNRQACQSDSKLSFAPDGSTVVTMCPTCTYTYAFRLAENGRDLENKHYAELLFQNQLDWDQVIANLTGMWGGEYAAWLMSVLY